MFNKTTLRKFIAPKHQQYSSRNPKSEAPNPKQTQRQINLKSGKSKTPNPTEAGLGFYLFCSLKLFRISDFVLRIFCSSRLCAFARVTPIGLRLCRTSLRLILPGILTNNHIDERRAVLLQSALERRLDCVGLLDPLAEY